MAFSEECPDRCCVLIMRRSERKTKHRTDSLKQCGSEVLFPQAGSLSVYIGGFLRLKATLIIMQQSTWAPPEINVMEIVTNGGESACLAGCSRTKAELRYQVMAPADP
ncbi:uncharacterized protein V6R79_015873 [Siganus canaliculatus]